MTIFPESRIVIRLLAFMVCALLVSSAHGAQADRTVTRWLLIDDQLNTWPISLEEVFADRIFYTDINGIDRSKPTDSIIAVIHNVDDEPSTAVVLETENGPIRIAQKSTRWTGPFITLTDGQVLTGGLRGSENDGETLVWNTELLGRLSISLERVRFIHLHALESENTPGGPEVTIESAETHIDRLLANAGAGDVLELVNGDRLFGFLVGIEPDRMLLETDELVEVPMNRAANVLVRNPSERPAYDACRVWMEQGMAVDVDCSRFLTQGDALTLALPGQDDRSIGFASARAIAFKTGAIHPLAALTPERMESAPNGAGFSWFESSAAPTVENMNRPMRLGDVTIRGPVEVVYAVPDNVARFACEAVVPGEALEWADYELIILAGQRELFRSTFNREHDREAINLDWPQNEIDLRIIIKEGGRGPIQDVVRLERPLFLLAE